MRVSVPGVPGVYYDTDAGTTAIATVFSAAGRRAPKPKGYAIQALPYLWSFEVDLREVPNDHPIQYLHPEGAQSLGELSPERGIRQAGTELESVFRFAWEVNREVESATNRVLGRSSDDDDGVVIEIEDGRVNVGGDELETDEFDLEESEREPIDVDIDADTGSETADEFDASEAADEFDAESDAFTDESDANGFDTGDER